MADKQFLLVVYDISSDRRRTRLHDLLLDYGTPVQYSVFECLLTKKEMETMHKRIKKVIRPKTDQLRFYTLCAECLKNVQVTCGKEVLSSEVPSIIAG